MNGSSAWLRALIAIVAVAIALQLVVDLIRPIAGYLLVAIAIAGVIAAIRWWRNNRW